MMRYARGSCESWFGLVTRVSSSVVLLFSKASRRGDGGALRRGHRK
jgi:hypothetical protein